MEFRENEAIYLQIANRVSDDILRGRWNAEDKIPSVRDLAVEMQVNPNTVIRTYELLENQGLIYTKRGLGFFVTTDALQRIKIQKKDRFLQTDLPDVFTKMYLLNIGEEEIAELYKEFKSNHIKK